MKKILLKVSVVLLFCIALPSITSIADDIKAYIVTHEIILENNSVNDILSNPILSYQDTTYLSIRDIAKIFNKQVEWDEGKNKVILNDMNKEEKMQPVIQDSNTALAIGEAIICQFFSEKVCDNTRYNVSKAQADHKNAMPFYIVSAVFQENNDMECGIFDVIVEINSYTGEIISVSEKVNEKSDKGTVLLTRFRDSIKRNNTPVTRLTD